MSNPMKYVKDLEAAGFERRQAEAQVQVVLDALEGDLVTKSEFAVFKEHIDRKFSVVDHRFSELELRLFVKLSMVTAASVTVGVSVLAWLIQIK
jgi:hypothetical protein